MFWERTFWLLQSRFRGCVREGQAVSHSMACRAPPMAGVWVWLHSILGDGDGSECSALNSAFAPLSNLGQAPPRHGRLRTPASRVTEALNEHVCKTSLRMFARMRRT